MLLPPLSRALRRSFMILAALACALVSPVLKAQSASAADGFNPQVGGSVSAVVIQPDGKIIIGGIFSTLQPNGSASAVSASGLARLNVDGTVDTTFNIPSLTASSTGNAGIGAQINVLALQSDGKILVGGNFGTSTGQNYLIRLNPNGTIDSTFTPVLAGNVNGAVTAIYVQTAAASPTVAASGNILIGGNFTSITAGGAAAITRNHVARLLRANGAVDTTWDANANAQVDCFAVQSDGNIILGGAFTSINPTYLPAATAPIRSYIARVSGTTGALDTTYDPEANNQVAAMFLQQNGQLVIAGDFSTLQPLQDDGTYLATAAGVGFMARLNTDGTLDSSFSAQASANISVMVQAPSGKILIGGNIGSLVSTGTTTTTVANFAQLNYDGTYDTTFVPLVNATVNAIAVQTDGKIVIGGIFTQVTSEYATDGIKRMGMARVTAQGILDTDFNPSAFGGIGAIAVDSSGRYLVGGSFTSINGSTIRNLARLLPSGAVDPTFWNPNPNQAVNAIAIQSNGDILIGGPFTQLTPNSTSGDQQVYYMAQLNPDGTQITSFNPYPNGPVLAICIEPDGRILIGGSFAQLTPNGASFPTTAIDMARINSDGTMDNQFLPDPAGVVHGLVIDSTGQYVIAVGEFGSLTPIYDDDTTDAAYVARINLSNSTIDPSFTPNPNNYVYSVALQANGQIVFGGVFTSVTPSQTPIDPTTGIEEPTIRNGICRVNADGSLDTNFDPEPDGDVLAVAINPSNQQIYMGGLFQNIQGVHQPYLARLNTVGTLDTGFNAILNGVVDVIQPFANDQFLVGGAFTTVTPAGSTTPVTVNHLVRFNQGGSIDTTFNLTATIGGTINTLALEPNGELLVGGSFTNIDGVFAANSARFWADGSFDTGFGPNTNGPVNTMVVESQGSSIYIGGSFSTISGNNSNNLARVNDDASFDPGFDAEPNGQVFAIAPQLNGQLVIGGTFSQVTSMYGNNELPVAVTNLARVAGSNGVVDTTFNPQPNGAVFAVAVQPNGQILVGGNFTTIGGGAQAHLARINSDGSLDTTFNPAVAGGPINAIAIEPNGQILIGGLFASVGGVAQPYFARLNSTGTLDTTFAVTVNGPVNAVVLEDGGNATDSIVLGGAFTTVNGSTRNHIARFVPSSSTSTTLVLDSAYNPNADGTVNTIAFGFDGKSYLGGSFANVTNLPRIGLARVSATAVSGASIVGNSALNAFTWTLTGEVPEINDVVFESSPDGQTWTTLGAGVRSTTSPNSWTVSNVTEVPSGDIFIQALADTETTEYGSQSEINTVQHLYGTPISSFQSSTTASGVAGSPFYYEIAATNSPTSVTATGLPAGLTINPVLGVISGTPTVNPGTYPVTLTITNGNSNTVTQVINITITAASSGTAPVAPSSRLLNISTSGTVSLTQTLTIGFTIHGTSPKTVLLRAVGPALAAFGVATPLSQPHLTLYTSLSVPILAAEGWDGSAAIQEITARVGAFPLGETNGVPNTDTSVATVLQPGSYSFIITSGDGSTGTALGEVYDADLNPFTQMSYLANISSEGLVDSGDLLTGGFSVSGSGNKTVLIRGIGPTLSEFEVNPYLPDPLLNVYNSSDIPIAQNKQWGTPDTINASYPAATQAAITVAETTTGAFALPDASLDTAVLITLAPGTYTAQVTTAGGNSGTGMIEIYDDSF